MNNSSMPQIEIRENSDLKKHKNLYPENLHPGQWPRDGQNGYDKNVSIDFLIGYTTNDSRWTVRPNIFIKNNGPRGKWYAKQCDIGQIDEEIFSSSNTTLYIITW